MARIEFDIRAAVPPEATGAVLPDYQIEVYEVGDTWAEIREGYRWRICVRERYDWSVPGRIEFTAVDSGFATPGSHVVIDIEPAEGGESRLHVTWKPEVLSS